MIKIEKSKLWELARQDKEVKKELIVIVGIALLAAALLGPPLLFVVLLGVGIYYLAKKKKIKYEVK